MHDPAYILTASRAAFAELLQNVPPGHRQRLRYLERPEQIRGKRGVAVYLAAGWRERSDSDDMLETLRREGARVLKLPAQWAGECAA